MNSLLLEIISEPMPPSLQQWAWQNLEQSLRTELREAWGYDMPLVREDEHLLATPYRLVLHIYSMEGNVPKREIAERGPREDVPIKALEGFLSKHNISKEQCVVEETKKGRFWFYYQQSGGQRTEDILGTAIVQAITKMKWPKIMRFANENAIWIRPLQRLVATFNGQALKGGFDCISKSWQAEGNGSSYLAYQSTTWDDMLNISSSDKPNEVAVQCPDDYKKMGILLKAADRVLHLGKQTPHKNEQWLQNIARLLERGFLLKCELKNDFRNLPDEVIKAALLDHMKVWVWHIDKQTIQFYAGIEERRDGSQDRALIRKGYEKVAVARLRDADFFWQEDAKQNLEARLALIDKQIWHKDLASVGKKARRLEHLSGCIAQALNGSDEEIILAKRAGLLSKSDLSTDLVGEYAALQGVIGGYYAIREEENPRVAAAIKGQYSQERLVTDDVVALALFLADRMDTLVGMWKSENIPTSSRDPFALKRATKEVASVLYQIKTPISFAELANLAQEGWQEHNLEKDSSWHAGLYTYYQDRLVETITNSTFEKAVIASVVRGSQAESPAESPAGNQAESPAGNQAVNLVVNRTVNLPAKTIREQFEGLLELDKNGVLFSLSEMFRRATGLLDNETPTQEYDPKLCNNAQEKVFADTLKEIEKEIGKTGSDVVGYGGRMLGAKPAFDEFCDNVRILDNADNQQTANRKKLLQTLINKLQLVGAFVPLVRFYSQREEQK